MSSLETTLPPPSTFDLLRDRGQIFESIRAGTDTALTLGRSALAALLGSALFGLALGSFAWEPQQVLASAIKVPLLLLGTAVLCFPTFYMLQSCPSSTSLPPPPGSSSLATGWRPAKPPQVRWQTSRNAVARRFLESRRGEGWPVRFRFEATGVGDL